MIPYKETQRQWLHISMLVFALLLRYLPPPWALFFAIGAFIHNVMLLPRYAPQFFRSKEHLMQGIAIYPLMVALLILFFPNSPILVVCAWAILAAGDGFSTLIGKRWPLVPLPWNPQKSLGGLLAFILFASIFAVLLMAWTGPIPSFYHLIFVAVGAAAVAGVYETIDFPLDDNVVVTLVAAVFCYLLWHTNFEFVGSQAVSTTWMYAAGLNLFLGILAYQFRLVSFTGVLGGVPLGLLILVQGGLDLFCLLFLFFALGSFVTHWGYNRKLKMGLAQEKGGRRGARNALANCLLAVIAAILVGLTEGADAILLLFYTTALATTLSDTVSSEMGQLYGHSPFLPTSFRLVPPGTVGAISVEGTFCGMGASIVFAFMAWAFTVISLSMVPIVILSSWFGFYMESYISAYWIEKNNELNGEWMNLLNTFLGGTFALALALLIQIL